MKKKEPKSPILQKLIAGTWYKVGDKFEITNIKDRVYFIKMDNPDPRGNYRIKGKKGIVRFI